MYRHSLAPVSVAVFADRVFWTDLHFSDVLYHRKGVTNSREKITVGISAMTAITAVDLNAQLRGLCLAFPCIVAKCETRALGQRKPPRGLGWVVPPNTLAYRSYRGRVFTGQLTQPTVPKH